MPNYWSMRRKSSTRSDRGGPVECRTLSLSEVRGLRSIPSGYVTSRVYDVVREEDEDHVRWTLTESELRRPFSKLYDNGRVDEWLASYGDAGPPDALRFEGAFEAQDLAGLLTWRPMDWNETVWLVDLRVREECRGRGVGSTLVGFLQDETRRMGMRGIMVETQTTNVPAISFYRKHGFAISGVNDHLYSNRDLERQEVALLLFWESGQVG